MSYQKRKEKVYRRKKIRNIFIALFFIYLVSRSIPIALARSAKTILPVEHTIYNSIQVQAVLIMEETVYDELGDKDFKDKNLEGERVPAGYKTSKATGSSDSIYTVKSAGMLSYKIDGYEDLYSPSDFENYTYDNLVIPEAVKDENTNPKEDFSNFKIINNFHWYLALKIDSIKDIKDYEIGNSIIIDYLDDNEEITGKVVFINQSEDKMVIIVRLNTNLKSYYDTRFPKVSIKMSEQSAYKIPSKALVDKDGQIGVYIKEFNGIVKFRPLAIIETNPEETCVYIGDDKGNIEIKGQEKLVRTITLYDEIFMNPSSIKEGQIID